MGFFVFLCHNAAPKPYAITSVSNIRSFEIQENQDRKGHKGFLKFQKSFIAFRWPEKCSHIFTKCVQFFQDPVKAPNEHSVMAEHYKTLHICKARNLASSAQSYFAVVAGNSLLADYASLNVVFFQASSKLEFRWSKDGWRGLSAIPKWSLCPTSCCNRSLFCWLRPCAVGFPLSSGSICHYLLLKPSMEKQVGPLQHPE